MNMSVFLTLMLIVMMVSATALFFALALWAICLALRTLGISLDRGKSIEAAMNREREETAKRERRMAGRIVE